jgi:hypothetical protein
VNIVFDEIVKFFFFIFAVMATDLLQNNKAKSFLRFSSTISKRMTKIKNLFQFSERHNPANVTEKIIFLYKVASSVEQVFDIVN